MDFDFDDLTIDFTDVKSASFEVLPAGWYLSRVTDVSPVATKNAGKLPVGTPGLNWEFTVQEGDFENRKLWTNTWLYATTEGFLKSLVAATAGKEASESSMSVKEIVDVVVGMDLWVQVRVRNSQQYGEQNDIRGYRHVSNPPPVTAGGSNSKATSFLP